MSQDSIIELIEKIAREIVLADHLDFPALNSINEKLKQVSVLVESLDYPALLHEHICKARDLVNAIILDEVDHSEFVYLNITKAITSYQKLFVNDMPFADIRLPDFDLAYIPVVSEIKEPEAVRDESHSEELPLVTESENEFPLESDQAVDTDKDGDEVDEKVSVEDAEIIGDMIAAMDSDEVVDESVEHIEDTSDSLSFEESLDAEISDDAIKVERPELEAVESSVSDEESGVLLDADVSSVADGAEAIVVDSSSPVVISGKSFQVFDPELASAFVPGRPDGERAFAVVLPEIVDDVIFSEFLARQGGVLEEMEESILNYESTGETCHLDLYKRIIHTIKGEFGMLGLEDLSELCHVIEDRLIADDPHSLADLLFEFKDWLSRLYKYYNWIGAEPCAWHEMLKRIQTFKDSDEMRGSVVSANFSGGVSGSSGEVDSVVESSAVVEDDVVIASDKIDDVSSSVVVEAEEPEPEPEIDVEPVDLGVMPMPDDFELLCDFIGEAREYLDAVDLSLLELEKNTENDEAINTIYRAFHTIKGVSGFLGLPEIQRLSHEFENLLDLARQNIIKLSGIYLEVTFETVDLIRKMLILITECMEAERNDIPRDASIDGLVGRVIEMIKDVGCGKETISGEGADSDSELDELMRQAGRGAELEQAIVSEELEELGAEPVDLVAAVEVKKAEVKKPASAVNVKVVAADRKVAVVETTTGGGGGKSEGGGARGKQGGGGGTGGQVKETVRVDSSRLDLLVDTIGELVIAEAMISQSVEMSISVNHQDSKLSRLFTHLDKITRELQEMATSLRMVPVRSTFQRMARLIRDTAKKTNKRVNCQMVGEDTELDKTVVDQIADPLVHMVRNAVDHGIEKTGAERVKNGKPEAGTVVLRSFHRGGSIYIEIEDDGGGLDKDRILEKAISLGLVNESDALSDKEIFNLIFAPGFSTASQVSDLSGRGVGMDVVKRNIQSLRGQIEISSEPGKGTLFSLRLPLTLAIIEGMVVGVGDQKYAFPLLSITRMFKAGDAMVRRVFDRGEMLFVNNELIPLFHLSELFGIPSDYNDYSEGAVVVVENDGKKLGVMVDTLMGQQQVVIKSLGESLKGIKGIAGGAIMPDGLVGLIIDIDGLLRISNELPCEEDLKVAC